MSDEFLDIFDKDNKPLGIKKRRSLVHKEMKDWHRATSIWIINENNEVLCQKRSSKIKEQPGRWQSYFGGHLEAGESYEENAVRELEEELGIKIKIEDLTFSGYRSSDLHKTWLKVYIFYCKNNQKIVKQEKEIDELKWVDFTTLKKMFQEGIFCNRVNQKLFQILDRREVKTGSN